MFIVAFSPSIHKLYAATMHILQLKLPLKTLEIMWKFP